MAISFAKSALNRYRRMPMMGKVFIVLAFSVTMSYALNLACPVGLASL
jgi:hypothetical protein